MNTNIHGLLAVLKVAAKAGISAANIARPENREVYNELAGYIYNYISEESYRISGMGSKLNAYSDYESYDDIYDIAVMKTIGCLDSLVRISTEPYSEARLINYIKAALSSVMTDTIRRKENEKTYFASIGDDAYEEISEGGQSWCSQTDANPGISRSLRYENNIEAGYMDRNMIEEIFSRLADAKVTQFETFALIAIEYLGCKPRDIVPELTSHEDFDLLYNTAVEALGSRLNDDADSFEYLKDLPRTGMDKEDFYEAGAMSARISHAKERALKKIRSSITASMAA